MEKARQISDDGLDGVEFSGNSRSVQLSDRLRTATHLLISAPPGPNGDPIIEWHGADIAASRSLEWIGYLSTIGVYGDRQGAWIDESAEPLPTAERSRRRLAAERQWQEHCRLSGTQLQVFRLGGIYGPGRSAIESMRDGTARRIIKQGQVFNRIHVDDIASVLHAAIEGRGQSITVNVVDDEPAPPQDVVCHAAELLGLAPPPEVPFEQAELSAISRSFFAENKRVRNDLMKRTFGIELRHPTYREGLRAIAAGVAPVTGRS